MIFHTSDTHFFHKNILHLGDGRPFDDIGVHDTTMRNNWNAVVEVGDMVIHHGDVAMGEWPVGLRSLRHLNGYKVLIPGNHDRVSSLESQARRDRFMDNYLDVFDEVWNENGETTVINGVTFRLSHYPYNGDHSPYDRHTQLRPFDDGLPLLHGHTHQTEKLTLSAKGSVMLSVGVDANDFIPVSQDELFRRYLLVKA